jgi:hypothetical protein
LFRRGKTNEALLHCLLCAVSCCAVSVRCTPPSWCAILPPGLQIPDAARPGAGFDVERATQALLDLLSPEQRARSDAYFEGGYWLRLWQFLYGSRDRAGVAGQRRFALDARLGAKRSKSLWWQSVIYAVLWLVAGFALGPAAVDLRRLRARTPVRPGHAGLRCWFLDQLKGLAGRLVITPWVLGLLLSGTASRRARAGGCGQRRCSPSYSPLRDHARAGVRRPAVQRLQAAARRPGA